VKQKDCFQIRLRLHFSWSKFSERIGAGQDRAQNQKSVGKFFSFGTEISSKFQGGSGAVKIKIQHLGPKGKPSVSYRVKFSSKKVRISFNKRNIVRNLSFSSLEASPPKADRSKLARIFQAFLNSKESVRSEI